MNAKKGIEKFFKETIKFVQEKPEQALMRICAFGLLYALFLIVLPKPPVYYTVLYLEPDYYGENRLGLFSRFGIENHESANYNYETSFFLDTMNDNNSFSSVLLGKKYYSIEKDQNLSGFISFALPGGISSNSRFRIQTSAFGEEYSVHFWLKGKNSS